MIIGLIKEKIICRRQKYAVSGKFKLQLPTSAENPVFLFEFNSEKPCLSDNNTIERKLFEVNNNVQICSMMSELSITDNPFSAVYLDYYAEKYVTKLTEEKHKLEALLAECEEKSALVKDRITNSDGKEEISCLNECIYTISRKRKLAAVGVDDAIPLSLQTDPRYSTLSNKSEDSFKKEFLDAVVQMGVMFGQQVSYTMEVPVSKPHTMFSGRLDAIINSTLIVSFASEMKTIEDDQEMDVCPEVVCEFKGANAQDPSLQAVYGAVSFITRDEVINQRPRDVFSLCVTRQGVEFLKVSLADFNLTVTSVLKSSNVHQIAAVVAKALFNK